MTKLSRDAARCFAGMFNGCKSKGVIFQPDKNDFLFIGKAECEEDWRKTWGELRKAGLILWTEEDVPTHDGKRMVYVHLTITKAGRDFREEDLRQWRARQEQGE